MNFDTPSHGSSEGPPIASDCQLGIDTHFGFASSAQETQAWSPIDVTLEDNTLFAIPFEVNSQSSPWSPTVCTQKGFLGFSASSLSESCPLLSPPGHQSLTNSFGRSSYGSSLRTWDTASTVASIYDPCFEDSITEEYGIGIAQTMDPSRLNRGMPLPTSTLSMSQTTPEVPPLPGHMITCPKDRTADQHGPPVPSKPLKGQGIYHCTVCQAQINRKWDFERHENSHDPQGYWTCMLGDPAVQTTAGWTCVFCDCFKQTRTEMAQHLKKNHRFHECTNKPHSTRTWLRKDKLRQHLQQVHSLSKNSRGWESWYRDPTRKKRAWGCGFCGACSFTWEGTYSK